MLSAQILTQTDHVSSSSDTAGTDCFNDEIRNSPEIDLESYCFSVNEIPEICVASSGRDNSMCYTFDQFYPSCEPATILSVEFRIRATSSWECEVPLKFVIVNEDGETIEESDDGERTYIVSLTENLQEVLTYQICLDYPDNSQATEGCEYCIDGIERVASYECGDRIDVCCKPKGVQSEPFEPVYITSGEDTPIYQADFVSSGESTFEELSINEVQLMGNSPLNFIEIKGNPNQMVCRMKCM